MSTELIINATLPEIRIAMMEGGEIQELAIERSGQKGIVGNIYKGRVTRVLPGMQAAFVDIGLEKAAFLYVDDVFVHSDIWEDEPVQEGPRIPVPLDTPINANQENQQENQENQENNQQEAASADSDNNESNETADYSDDEIPGDDGDEDSEDDSDEDDEPVEMGSDPDDKSENPSGTISPPEFVAQPRRDDSEDDIGNRGGGSSGSDEAQSPQEGAQSDSGTPQEAGAEGQDRGRSARPPRRGAGGGGGRDRYQRGPRRNNNQSNFKGRRPHAEERRPRYAIDVDPAAIRELSESAQGGRPDSMNYTQAIPEGSVPPHAEVVSPVAKEMGEKRVQIRPEFKDQRGRDRRVKGRNSMGPTRERANIQDLLTEGQEVIVQVAKDPIATKGARLTCHLSLPGRHLVCMPTINHVGVSRRIESDQERRRLRDYVDANRPSHLGFIVRTASASGRQQSERRIKQDIDYLAGLWEEIRQKANTVGAPSLIYEDLNPVLRAIRDWVTDEIDKIIVDSKYHHSEILRFVNSFMPSLRQKVELYHGDIPVFDAYGISTELSRALERKVWLKSGGYIVIDQAEALVAIDINTGRYVGKRNLEDTILKTNLEAAHEIAYQLRLRNCGGIIIIDFIDMERDENRQKVYRTFEEALKKDRARPSILKISELGLVEMTRKRTRDTFIRTLCESCSHCEGKGFVKSRRTVAYEILRELEREALQKDINKLLINAHADVIDILAIDERDTLDQIERRHHKQIYLQSVGDFHLEQYELSTEKKERQVRSMNRDRIVKPPPRIPTPIDRSAQEPAGSGDAQEEDSESYSYNDESEIKSSPPRVTRPASSESIDPPSLSNAPKNEDDFNDEDRLAFLRAQAAQDAAIANLAAPEQAGNMRPKPRNPRWDNKRGPGPVGARNNNHRNNNGRRPNNGPASRDNRGAGPRRFGRGGGGYDNRRPYPQNGPIAEGGAPNPHYEAQVRPVDSQESNQEKVTTPVVTSSDDSGDQSNPPT